MLASGADKSGHLARVPLVPARVGGEVAVGLDVEAEYGDRAEQREVPTRVADGWVSEAAQEVEAEYLSLGSAGSADAGLGVLSAARALRLDFVPLLQEQYDLLVGAEFWEDRFLAPLRAALSSPDLRREIEALGGYDVSRMGEILAQG